MPVLCPNCQRRLFDVTRTGGGEIAIKCRRCNQIVEVSLDQPNGRPIKAQPLRRGNIPHVIDTEQRGLR